MVTEAGVAAVIAAAVQARREVEAARASTTPISSHLQSPLIAIPANLQNDLAARSTTKMLNKKMTNTSALPLETRKRAKTGKTK
jgi:inner membrane protein involved in colicin E2 resistance